MLLHSLLFGLAGPLGRRRFGEQLQWVEGTRLAVGVDDGVPDDCLGQRRGVGRWIGCNNPDKDLLRIPIEERGQVYIESIADSQHKQL